MDCLLKDSSYIKSLYITASKTAVGQFNRIKKSFFLSVGDIPNDALSDLCSQLHGFHMLCLVLKNNWNGVYDILRAIEAHETNVLALVNDAASLTPSYCPKNFLEVIEKYGVEYMNTAIKVRELSTSLRKKEELLTEKLKAIASIEKELCSRCALYKEVQKNEKKYLEAKNNASKKLASRKKKLDDSICELDNATEKCRRSMKMVLENQHRFLKSMFDLLVSHRSSLRRAFKDSLDFSGQFASNSLNSEPFLMKPFRDSVTKSPCTTNGSSLTLSNEKQLTSQEETLEPRKSAYPSPAFDEFGLGSFGSQAFGPC